MLTGLVMQSPGIIQMIFQRQYVEFKRKQPYATNKEILEAILQLRYFTKDMLDGMSPDAARDFLQQPWRQAIIKSVIERVQTVDDLVKYVVEEYEQFWKSTPDIFGLNTRIAEILDYYRPAG